MIDGVLVMDDFLADPARYRAEALKGEFKTYDFETCSFHGISAPAPQIVPERLARMIPHLKYTLSFFRKSPAGQEEPHFIHTDVDMGEWSAILYLNPTPPESDGTSFWKNDAAGVVESDVPHEYSNAGKTPEGWTLREFVDGKFNRLMIFRSSLFHSRAIYENWGSGDTARLTQVTFGTGAI